MSRRRNLLFSLAATFVGLMTFVYSTFAAVASAVDDSRASVSTPSALRPFEPSEELVFEGEFSRLLLRGIKIAELRFKTTRAPANPTTNTTVAAQDSAASDKRTEVAPAPLLFTAEVVSRGWFRKLFGINFHYRTESTVEQKSFHILSTKTLDEQGKRVRESEAVFDRKQDKITWTQRDPNDPTRPPRIVNAPLAGAQHDIITALYFLRTQALTPGKTFELVVSDSGRVYHVPIKVFAEKKKMKSTVGRVSVVRVEVEMFGKGRLVENEGRMTIWMTDDARRLPVRARVSSDLGTLDLTLKRVSNGGTRS